MARRLSIQPVWGMGERKPSTGVLDTAENLMENIDQLAEVLDNLTEKYNTEMERLAPYDFDEVVVVVTDAEGNTQNPRQRSRSVADVRNSRELNLFCKLKTCLDSTRHLIGSLRKEKGRLMKRELSVECKLGEIEDYKVHVKQDLTSLNEMVDLLTNKVFNLEAQLCDEQDKSETLKYERDDLETRLTQTDTLLKAEENKNHHLRLENKELKYQNEVLVVENAKLKEILREKTEGSESENTVKALTSKDRKPSSQLLPDLIEDSNSSEDVYVNEESATVRL